MKQRKWRVLLSMALAICLCLSAVIPVSAAGADGSGWLDDLFSWLSGENGTQHDADVNREADGEAEVLSGTTIEYVTKEKSVPLDDGTFYRIVHIDCGRKYFSVDELKKIIDYAAGSNYTHVELAFGNDGLRFLLDNMSVTANGTTYSNKNVTNAVKAGNKAFYDAGTNELTQTEMDKLIEYAKGKQIGIIPMFDAPGHLYALIEAMNGDILNLGVKWSQASVSGVSKNRAIDPTDVKGVNFVQALMQKYITYFAGKGCTMFNIAADECGFTSMDTDTYTAYAKMVNSMAAMVQNAGMTALAFSDGIYHKNITTNSKFDTDIAVCFWTNNEQYSTPDELKAEGFKIINTHNKWYYVLGRETGTGWGSKTVYSYEFSKYYTDKEASDCMKVDGDTDKSVVPVGCMNALWCDDPGANVNWDNVKSHISYLAELNPNSFTTPEIKTVDIPADAGNGAGNVVIKGLEGQTAEVTIEAVKSNIDLYDVKEYKSYNVSPTIDGEAYSGEGTVSLPVPTEWTETSRIRAYIVTDGAIERLSGTYTDGFYTFNVPHFSEMGLLYVNAVPDLTDVGNLYVQLWFTNVTIESENTTPTTKTWHNPTGYKGQDIRAKYLTFDPETIYTYGEDGVLLSKLVPNNIIRYENNGTYWIEKQTGKDKTNLIFHKGKALDINYRQYVWDTDYCNNDGGIDFKYIRLYNKRWEVSPSGEAGSWTSVGKSVVQNDYNENGYQIVAYYRQRTDIVKEIYTDLVDWPTLPHTELEKGFCLLDYKVVYASGLEDPTSFPITGKTMSFACGEGVQNSVKDTDTNVYYRKLNTLSATAVPGYEIYMITLTPSSDTASTKVASSASNATNYTYKGTEKVVWVDDENNLPVKFQDASTHYSSISGNIKYSVGGDPTISGVEIYASQAMLVTYYIRPIVNTDSLTVRYVDKTDKNYRFHSYNINVPSGTVFKENISLNRDNWKSQLVDGEVTNDQGKTEIVSADLSTMPQIGAKYRRAIYKCVDVERSDDGKVVTLYYEFTVDKTFVVDFGLPLVIYPTDFSDNLTNATITGIAWDGVTYADITRTDNNGIKYTPKAHTTIDGADNFEITYTGKSIDTSDPGKEYDTVTFHVTVLPASNVYYEESFFNIDAKWSSTNPDTVSNGQQTTETLGQTGHNNYGYDSAYDLDAEYSGGKAYRAEIDVDTAFSYNKRPTASFTFKGTGFDIVSECSNKTGMLYVRVGDKDNKYEKSYLVDTYLNGDEDGIIENGSMTYQIPVVRCTDVLKYGTHIVTIAGLVDSSSGAVKNGTSNAAVYDMDGYSDDAASRIYAMLESLGVTDEEMENLEFVYMDENSILNGGSGVATYSDDDRLFTATYSADSYADTPYYVYLDGFRVYNPLGFEGDNADTVDGLTKSDYSADGESGFEYVPVYEMVSDTNSDKNTVYIETDTQTKASTIRENWTNYRINGPYNEIYLTKGQSIALKFDGLGGKNIQISAKSVDGKKISTNKIGSNKIASCTEMYYDWEVEASGIVVISNTGETGVLSISEIKLPSGATAQAMDENDKEIALAIVNSFYADPEPEEPETFEPDYLNAYALPVAFRRLGATITVTSSIEEEMEVFIKAGEDGKITKLDPTNTRMVRWGLTDKYLYTFNTGRLSRGEYTYYVYAVMNGVMSEPIPVSFVVW